MCSSDLPLPAAHLPVWRRLADDLVSTSTTGVPVIVDVGSDEFPSWLEPVVDHTVMVIRPCYVSLRRAVNHRRRDHLADEVIVVSERDRALSARDVETVLGCHVSAEVPVHPDIARRIDAGLLLSRPPDRLLSPLRSMVEDHA